MAKIKNNGLNNELKINNIQSILLDFCANLSIIFSLFIPFVVSLFMYIKTKDL